MTPSACSTSVRYPAEECLGRSDPDDTADRHIKLKRSIGIVYRLVKSKRWLSERKLQCPKESLEAEHARASDTAGSAISRVLVTTLELID